MKERYMIYGRVVDHDDFLDLSNEAQLLYFRLNGEADTVGFVSGIRAILRKYGFEKEHLTELLELGLVLSFKGGKLLYITHYLIANMSLYRKDRPPRTEFSDELGQLATALQEHDNNPNMLGLPMVYQRYTVIEPNINQPNVKYKKTQSAIQSAKEDHEDAPIRAHEDHEDAPIRANSDEDYGDTPLSERLTLTDWARLNAEFDNEELFDLVNELDDRLNDDSNHVIHPYEYVRQTAESEGITKRRYNND